MKQITVLFIVVALMFGACKDKNAAKNNNKAPETTTQTETKPAEKPQPVQPTANVSANEQAEKDAVIIADYLKEKGIEAKATPSGINYIIETEGAGDHPTIDDKVEVHYKGTLLDGTEFDSSYGRGKPATFPLKSVVKGWQEGIPLLKKGGKGKLIIPSGMAYGPRAIGDKIPANSVLIFDVELLNILDK
jgi:FKBP-type peptidyl-prolyl cis-trans isomerase